MGGGLDTYGLDVDGLVSFSVDRAPDNPSSFHSMDVYARRNDRESNGNHHYRYRVRVFGSTAMDVRIQKQVGGTWTWLTDNLPANTTFVPGAKYWIRWEAFGTSPATTVRIRVWRDATEEPTAWHASAVVDEPALDVSGTSGIRFQPTQSELQVNWPIRVHYDDFRYRLRTP